MIVVLANYRDVAYGSSDFNLFGWEMGWTARSIFLGQGFSSPYQQLTGPTALVPPLYPYLLAGIFKLFGLYTAQSRLRHARTQCVVLVARLPAHLLLHPQLAG